MSMDPNIVPTPGFDLPPVQVPEASPQPPKAAELPAQQMTEKQNIEQPAMASSMAPPPTPAGLLPQIDPITMQPVQATPPTAAVSSTAASTSVDDLEAADSDLIEKAWVSKAKAIVERTREDPYQQNKQITKVKSEYIKKRYNQELKVSDE